MKVLLKLFWKDGIHLPCNLNKGRLRAQGYERHGYIRKIENSDVIYCEWEKCNQNEKEITPKEDKSGYKERKHK